MAKTKEYEQTDAEARIYLAMSQMPGGVCDPLQSAADKVRKGGRANPWETGHAPLRWEDVATYFEAMKEHLTDLYERKQEVEHRAAALQSDVDAIERVGAILLRGAAKEEE